MNKYIKPDVEQGISLLKVAINNALFDLEEGNEKEIVLGDFVPFSLVVECAEERGWIASPYLNDDMTNGWEVDCWYYMIIPNTEKEVCISSCLWKGQKTKIYICNEENRS